MSVLADLIQHAPTIGATIGGAGLGALAKPAFNFFLARRKGEVAREADLLASALERITKLEQDAERERAHCSQQVEQQRVLYEAKLEALRHELHNVENSFDGLLLAIKHAPEKAAEIVADVSARRRAKATASK